jgi:hypothetical protein
MTDRKSDTMFTYGPNKLAELSWKFLQYKLHVNCKDEHKYLDEFHGVHPINVEKCCGVRVCDEDYGLRFGSNTQENRINVYTPLYLNEINEAIMFANRCEY